MLVACGGAERPAATPAADSSGAQQESVQSSPAEPSPAEMSDSPQAAPASAGASNDTSKKREAVLRGTRGDLQKALRELDASLGDCTNACRALVSLEHAAFHLCEMASDAGDQSSCSDAKGRVIHARSQIKASCGTCSNGAPLDSASPIH
ncbi:MAG: hypothetical protein ABI551_26135 [Polyangiaceae bacterium]